MTTSLETKTESRSAAIRYGLGLFAAVLSLLLRKALMPLLGPHTPYFTAWSAIVFAAWYCGLGPSIVAMLASLFGVWYWFLPPFGSFHMEEPTYQIAGMIGFVILSSFIIALGETNRRAVIRAENEISERKLAEAALRQAHDQLEERVKERTKALDSVNESLRALSAQLQKTQDEERRRIARELHDSVGQTLTALKINLATGQFLKINDDAKSLFSDSASLVDQVTKEIRTISYLLHPPLLEIAGLASALRFYVDGFAERSKISVELDIPNEFDKLGDAVEITLFRVVQECLTNIHRHSGSATAGIRIHRLDGHIELQVRDAGKGIPAERQLALDSASGVGFRGMRERIAQLGGSLELQSDGNGTNVKAVIPITQS
jgi:signal transduction histidine kinase